MIFPTLLKVFVKKTLQESSMVGDGVMNHTRSEFISDKFVPTSERDLAIIQSNMRGKTNGTSTEGKRGTLTEPNQKLVIKII